MKVANSGISFARAGIGKWIVGGRRWPLLDSAVRRRHSGCKRYGGGSACRREPALRRQVLGLRRSTKVARRALQPTSADARINRSRRCFLVAEDDVPARSFVSILPRTARRLSAPGSRAGADADRQPALPSRFRRRSAAEAARLILGDFPEPDRRRRLARRAGRDRRILCGARFRAHLGRPDDGLTTAGRAVARAARARGDDGINLVRLARCRTRSCPSSLADELARTEIAIAAAVVVYAEQASGLARSPRHVFRL